MVMVAWVEGASMDPMERVDALLDAPLARLRKQPVHETGLRAEAGARRRVDLFTRSRS